jgi:hypothetical protein
LDTIPPITLPSGDPTSWLRQIIRPTGDDDSIANPFFPLIWQSVITLSPSVDGVASNKYSERTASELYRVGLLVSSISSELRGKIWQTSAPLRGYGRQLLKQENEDFRNIRFGHFTVAEPSVVESSSVNGGDVVKARSTIAILRSVYRYFVEFELDEGSAVSDHVRVGTPLTAAFACDGPIPTSMAQKQSILSDSGKIQIVQALASLRETYLNEASFNAKVESVTRAPGHNGDTAKVVVRLSIEIPDKLRSIDVAKSRNTLLEQLSHLGFETTQSSDNYSLRLSMGPFRVGEQCKVHLGPANESDANYFRVDKNWTNLKSPQ